MQKYLAYGEDHFIKIINFRDKTGRLKGKN